ncbi:RHS repeat-associated core domain-containing protein [Sphaerisporangium sp. NPDC049002]|uniref:RHS repeat-associated core domain-containing protein n=1 Tax=Sphaerisporangium sp. NPDC049002 TaxID=3155392 RepID=UPI0033E367F7
MSGGGFSYNYPIPVPPPVAGEAPQLALSYSSSSIDGLTNYTNNQASVAGMGWDVSTGFIERRFRGCADDVVESSKNPDQRNWKHQCWESPDENDGDAATTDYTTSHLTLSVEGKSSAIVKDRTSGGWKTVEDYGWKIDYSTSSQTGQSFWVVTTVDGTVYRFGYHRDSMWQTPYVGDDTGEPCRDQYSKTGAPGLCFAPWRWNLDQEIDPNGNVVDYTFTREENWYCKTVGALCQPGPLGDGRAFRVAYDRGGYLAQVAYGRNTNVTGSAHTAKVVFNAVDRGTPPASGVPWDNDTPTDLNCPSGPSDVITACDTPGPAFYISKRLDNVVTSVHNPATSGWDQVYRLEAGYKWVYTQIPQGLPPAGPVLWLDTLRPVGLAGDGPDIALPPVDFEATLLDNRADYNDSQGKPRLRFPRISTVYNGLGGRTDITYGQPNPCPYPSGYPTTGWDTGARDCYQATLGSYYDTNGIPRTSRAVYLKWLVTQTVDKDLVGGSPDMPTRYEYLGTPAWARAFNYMRATTLDGVLCTPPVSGYCKMLTEDWEEFRGYQQVRTIKGAGTSPDDYSVTTTAFYRGMYDDPLTNGTPKRTTVTDFEGNTYNDTRVLAGRTLQEQTWRATTINGQTLTTPAPVAPAAAEPVAARSGPTGPPIPPRTSGTQPQPDAAAQHHRAAAAPTGARMITAALAPARALVNGLRGMFGTTVFACTYPTWQKFGSYTTGNKVTWANHHWEALQASVGSEPGKITNAWKDLGDCTAAPTPTPTITQTPTPTPTTPPSGPTLGGYIEVGSTRYEYTTVPTGDGPGIYDPRLINTTRQATREAITTGFRYTDQRTTYDTYGLPTKVNNYGQTGDATDNTCTTTTYARNTTKWLLSYPATVERRAGDTCTTGALLGRTVTLYDGATSPTSNTPTVGNATQTRVYSSDSEYQTTGARYDSYGRTTSAIDAASKTTRIDYIPATGWPSNGMVTTNPLDHITTSRRSPYYGQLAEVRDANAKVTQLEYDALGRTTTLWTPQQPKSGGTAAATVSYTIPYDGNLGQPTSAAKTRLSKLQSGSGSTAIWVTQHTYIDGLGRLREQQSTSPASGRITTATAYDARGLTAAVSQPVHNAADAGTGLLNPAFTSLPQWSKTVYDGAERATAQIEYTGASELRRTMTTHFGDHYEAASQPPVGGKSVYWTDTSDKVVKIEEWPDATTHKDTSYTYDPEGHLTKMVDANGNIRSFTYDLLGRRITSQDPDAGVGEEHYDSAGRLSWTKDGNGQKLSYSYDDLGRKTAVWAGESGTGTKLSSWSYDTLAKGKLTSSSRYVNGYAYTSQVTDYDSMGRPTGSTLTIPSSEDLLAGDYTFTAAYNVAGNLTQVGMPAAGGLPAEKVTSTLTDLGLAKGLTSDFGGGFTYVNDTRYTATSRLAERYYGATGKIKRTVTWDNSTGWLSRVSTTVKADTSTPQLAQDDQYFYGAAGDITRILDAASAVSGSTTGQSECFSYDGLRRLSAAWTTTASSCTAGISGADGLGIDPYKQEYNYDLVGNLTSFTDNDQTSTYHYPTPGASSIRPNTVTSIDRPGGSTDSYAYDNTGRLKTRTVASKPATFEWNELGELSKATVDGQDTSMVYDADGERLIRRDPGGRITLYLGDMEVELADGQLMGKRYYSAPDGSTVAIRIGSGSLKWMTSGLHGSQQLGIDDGTGQVSRERYLPYGKRRGIDDLPFTDHGFLGKVEDDTTGLDYLSARYYDPNIARFISTDPVLDLTKPQAANPYSYAGDNPIGFSDPSGLSRDDGCQSPIEKSTQHCKEVAKWNSCVDKYGESSCKAKWKKAQEVELSKAIELAYVEYVKRCGSDANDIKRISQTCAEWILSGDGDPVTAHAKAHAANIKLVVDALLIAGFGPEEIAGTVVAKLGAQAAATILGKLPKFASIARKIAKGEALCNSFAPGTRVLMADGTLKPIEDIKLGDEVLATDPLTGQNESKPVVALIESQGQKDLVEITVDSDGDKGNAVGTVTATDKHPFWVDDQGHWFNASTLQAGMHLRTATGLSVKVLHLRAYQRANQRVHNLTIQGLRTYHVAVGTTDALVHNASGCGGIKNSLDSNEITGLNRNFGGSTTINGSLESMYANMDRYSSFWEKLGVVIRDIAGAHMFDNGNKRTAQAVVQALMKRNHISTGPNAAQLRKIIQQVATGKLTNVRDIAAALRGY